MPDFAPPSMMVLYFQCTNHYLAPGVKNRPVDPGAVSLRGVIDLLAPHEGIPLGRYARPNYYTQLANTAFQKRISQLPCLFHVAKKKKKKLCGFRWTI